MANHGETKMEHCFCGYMACIWINGGILCHVCILQLKPHRMSMTQIVSAGWFLSQVPAYLFLTCYHPGGFVDII